MQAHRNEVAASRHRAAGSEGQRNCRRDDSEFVSPSYTRDYPLVAKSGRGAMMEDVDGNTFLDFAAGIAVVATGHCHPEVVAAIQKQAAELIHMSGTDFYYPRHRRIGGETRVHCAGRGAEAGLLRQFRRRSDRSGHQAREISHQARQAHRLPRRFPRPHAWARSRLRPAERFSAKALARCSPASFTCRILTPIAARMACAPSALPRIA